MEQLSQRMSCQHDSRVENVLKIYYDEKHFILKKQKKKVPDYITTNEKEKTNR